MTTLEKIVKYSPYELNADQKNTINQIINFEELSTESKAELIKSYVCIASDFPKEIMPVWGKDKEKEELLADVLKPLGTNKMYSIVPIIDGNFHMTTIHELYK